MLGFELPVRLVVLKHIAAMLLVSGLAVSMAKAADTPPTIAGAKLVTAEDIVKAIAGGAVVIDTRVASEYAEEHIKGAVSVPYREKSGKAVDFDASQDQFDLSKLPADKGKAIVTYCNGPECWKGYKGAVFAVKAGYTNILWFRTGIPEWKAKGLPTEK